MEYLKVVTEILKASTIFPLTPQIANLHASSRKTYPEKRSAMCELVAIIITTQQQATGGCHQAYIHSGKITELFNHVKTFDKWNTLFSAVDVSQHYKSGVYPKTYTLTLSTEVTVKAIINNLIHGTLPYSIRKFEKAIAFTPPTKPDLTTYVRVDIDRLRQVMLVYSEDLMEERLWAWVFIKLAEKYNNLVPQYYMRKSNRLYAFGPTALQNRPSVIRKVVAPTYNSYDLSATAFSILLSCACPNKNNRATEYPLLHQYVLDTAAFRQTVLNQVTTGSGNSIETVKLIIAAIGFGSTLSEFTKFKRTVSRDSVRFLIRNQMIRGLRAEMEKLRNSLFPHLPKRITTTNPKYLVDVGNGAVPMLTQTQASADLYMSFETKIIEHIRMSTDTPSECVLVHDEIMTESIINTASMSSDIEQKFGITIHIKGP